MNEPNTISCPNCGQSYQLTPDQAPQYAGQTITCSKCQQPFTVPAAGAPAGMPPLPPAPQQPVPYASPPSFSQQEHAPQQSNGWAITSLVSACIGMVIPLIPGLIAIITGIVGLNRTKDPRVGGKGLAVAGISVGAVSILMSGCLISILLPSLNRAREQANRIKCASNMRQIGMALAIYSNEYMGQLPPDLDTLLKNGDVTSEVFVCPTGADVPAPAGTLLTAGPHLSYVYVPGQTFSVSAPGKATVLLYEPITTHSSDGSNFLFADGHVDWVPRGKAQQMIAELQQGQNPPPSGAGY